MQIYLFRARHLVSTGVIAIAIAACGDDSATSSAQSSGQGGAGEGGSSAAKGGGDGSGGAPSTSDATSSTGAGSSLPENEWTTIPFPSTAEVFTVWAEAANKVWIGADDGLYISRDGETLEKVDLGMPVSIRDISPDPFGVPAARAAGSSGAERIVLEYNAATEAWTPFAWSDGMSLQKAGAPLLRISSSGPTFWVTASDGSVVALYDPFGHLGGPSFADNRAGDVVGYGAQILGITGPSATLAFAGTTRGIMRFGGGQDWTRQTDDMWIWDLYRDGDTSEVWAVGPGIFGYDGDAARTWTTLSGPPSNTCAGPCEWRSIQPVGAELWVAGAGFVGRSADRASFTTLELAPDSQLYDVGGASVDDLWAVGAAGQVWRCVGDACGDPSSLP